jgi:serine/threonine protein kinase
MRSDVIHEVLEATAERPSHEWREALARHWPADPELVQQALVWLRAERAADQERPLLPGARYELQELLDRGATASVWRAYDRKLCRDVAIKVFHDARSLPLDRILSEARAACEVISDHVVRVHDVHDADLAYLVMELVGEYDSRGSTLRLGASGDRCRPRDPTELARWLRDVARGVRDAHLRNVFHRDLKPANVLITPISRRAKIADFGLAVTTADQPMDLVLRRGTSVVQIAGTPAFMAPEQARGIPARSDPDDPQDRAALVAIDVWGLGAIAFAWLAGRPPWRSSCDAEAWEVAIAGPPPDVPGRMPTGERIPRTLRRIVQRALAPVGERYASAAEVADELDAFLVRRPTSFERSRSARTILWARRNPQLTVTAVVAVALAAMTIAAWKTIERLHEQRADLVADMQQLETELRQRAESARRELASTEQELHTRTSALAALRGRLASAESEYRDTITAKNEALRTADESSRQLSTEIMTVRVERDLMQAYLAQVRRENELAMREREAVARERDAARVERDKANADREKARAEQARLEREREALRADRDRQAAARRRAEADLAHLAEQLSALIRAPESSPAEPPGRETTGAMH